MVNVPFFFEGGRKVFFGSAANRTTELAVSNPGAHYQEIGGNLYESNGSVWDQISSDGKALVKLNAISAGILPGEQLEIIGTMSGTDVALSLPADAYDQIMVVLVGAGGVAADTAAFSGKVGAALDKTVGNIQNYSRLDATAPGASIVFPAAGTSISVLFQNVMLGTFDITITGVTQAHDVIVLARKKA